MRRWLVLTGLALILSSCGGEEPVDTTLPSEPPMTTTRATTTSVAPATTTTTQPTTTTAPASTTRPEEPTEDETGPEDVVTTPDDPTLASDAWLGVIFRGDMEGVVPAGFEQVGGKCVGDLGAEEPCTLALEFARSRDNADTGLEEWLILLGRFRSRDAAGIPEWEVVDVLYVGFPQGRDLYLFTSECWSWHGFGVSQGGWESCSPPTPLVRAWEVDFPNEAIVEVEGDEDIFCQQECPLSAGDAPPPGVPDGNAP